MTTLVAMTEPELEDYLHTAIPEYAADKVAAGQWTEADALDRARQEYLKLLPAGVDSPGQHLFALRDATGDPVSCRQTGCGAGC